MKSGKQRRVELKEKRISRRESKAGKKPARKKEIPDGAVMVTTGNLAPSNSYGVPDFIQRGYYLDLPFTCPACGRQEVWTALQQRWWYEVAKGQVYSKAKFCRTCRRLKREGGAEARRINDLVRHIENQRLLRRTESDESP
ncbi:MAG: zinc-ribbon domain containing protein [Elusimicrobia bacterium]|nr:zinc-ribbon domain containing protein [Elusimicrobiota bacterium]